MSIADGRVCLVPQYAREMSHYGDRGRCPQNARQNSVCGDRDNEQEIHRILYAGMFSFLTVLCVFMFQTSIRLCCVK
jgi:hypothetical protein